MAGPNLTGEPQTRDYNLGRGIVYFAELDTVTNLPGAWRDLGNAPEFNITVALETLKHFSSRQGLKVTDAEVTLSQDVGFTFKLDEINHENLALTFSGTQAALTNASVAGFAEHTMIDSVEMGRWYDIVNASNVRAYDVALANLTVELSGTVDTALVEGVDYDLDIEMGRIFIRADGIVVVAGDSIDVTLAAAAGANGVDEVLALTQTAVVGALKFIGTNPNDNDRKSEYTFWQVKVKADGDLALIGDDWTQLGYTGTGERNASVPGDSKTLSVRTVRET